MASTSKDGEQRFIKRPPAKTPEARERQLVQLAVDVAEDRMLKGTASDGLLTHYLKLASVREEKERLKLDLENKLLQAKTDQIGSQVDSEQLAAKAIAAFRSYQTGEEGPDEY